jgi:protein ImuB
MFACVYAIGVCDHSALVELAYGFSPKVEETACDTVVLDIEGCEMLFGPPAATAVAIARQAAGLGIKANVAVASNPDAAIHAARAFKGVTVIPPGEELNRLGGLEIEDCGFRISDAGLGKSESSVRNPQSAIRNRQSLSPQSSVLSPELADALETLETWGVRTFRELAALPEAGIAQRLGPIGVKLQQLARGTNTRPLLLKKQAPVFERSIELDNPVELLEPLSFILSRLLNQLCATLNTYGLAANELKIRLRLEDRTEIDRTLRLPIAMRDPRTFLKLLMLDIESHPPQSAICAVSIAAEPANPRSIQKGLFQPLAPEPEKLELTIARLVKLVGDDNIGSPELVDTHRPGAFRMKRFGVKRRDEGKPKTRKGKRTSADRGLRIADSRLSPQPSVLSPQSSAPSPQPSVQSPQSSVLIPQSSALSPQSFNPQSAIRNPQSHMGFRVFRPPLRAKVESVSGRPTRISARAGSGIISGKIVRLAGPWRTSGEWWMKVKWDRAEWDVAVGGTASSEKQVLCRIYYDLRSDSWFVEGMYD